MDLKRKAVRTSELSVYFSFSSVFLCIKGPFEVSAVLLVANVIAFSRYEREHQNIFTSMMLSNTQSFARSVEFRA